MITEQPSVGRAMDIPLGQFALVAETLKQSNRRASAYRPGASLRDRGHVPHTPKPKERQQDHMGTTLEHVAQGLAVWRDELISPDHAAIDWMQYRERFTKPE